MSDALKEFKKKEKRWLRYYDYRERHRQGPKNQQIKGSRIWCYDITVNKLKKILKGQCGIKKIHRVDSGVTEIIHTCTKENWRQLHSKLEENQINTSGKDRIYG